MDKAVPLKVDLHCGVVAPERKLFFGELCERPIGALHDGVSIGYEGVTVHSAARDPRSFGGCSHSRPLCEFPQMVCGTADRSRGSAIGMKSQAPVFGPGPVMQSFYLVAFFALPETAACLILRLASRFLSASTRSGVSD